MSVSYNRLWKLLIDKNMSVAEMRRAADIAPNTVTRMKKDQEVTMAVLERICKVLDADFGDIVDYKNLVIPFAQPSGRWPQTGSDVPARLRQSCGG